MTATPKTEAAAALESENPDLFDYQALRNYFGFVVGAAVRRKFLALGVFASIMGLTVGALKVLPRTYHVESKLLAQRNQTIAALSNPGRSLGWDDVPLRAATETVLRHDNLVSLVQQTDLVRRWPLTRAPLPRLKDRIMLALRGPIAPEDQQAALVGSLGVQLKVTLGDGTVTISVDWPDAETAFELVESAQQNFLEARHVAEVSTVSEAISLLEAHALRLRATIDASVEQISKANEGKAPKAAAPVVRKLRPPREPTMDPEVAQLQVMLEGKRRAIKDLEEFHAKRLAELQARLADQKRVYSDLHPAVIEVQERIDVLQKQGPAQLVTLKQEERDLEAEILQRHGSIDRGDSNAPKVSLGPLPSHILRLERDAREMESDDPAVEHAKSELQFAMSKYGALLDRIDSARMELDTSRAAFKHRYTVIAPAEKPRFPIKPDRTRILFAALVGGLVMALFATTAADIRSGRILERWQVERQVGLEILADVRRV
ncbi:MAG TPA: hypothetical protein VMK66_18275 [Myxococcales bacterium]|nr:hypothetical protein [Myxococcales bacterium]